MADEPKPEIDMKEEKAKTKEIVEPKEEKPVEIPKTKEEEKPETEKSVQIKPKIKKAEAVVNGKNLPISTKYSSAICRFIQNKKIEEAIVDLEKVLANKKAVPMKGEIPHRKGKGMTSGRYPKRASEYFIKLLKSLQANASVNELDNPIIVEAIANIGSRPYGRFGRIRRKRTHIRIKAKEKKIEKKSIRRAKRK